MERHVTTLGVLYLVFSGLGILIGFFLFVVVTGSGLISGDSEAIFITGIIGTVLGSIFILLAIPGFIAAYGLFKFREWARILAIILGMINLINFPIGTALGIYTLWALLNQETIALFVSQNSPAPSN
jgi:hypothetical protein